MFDRLTELIADGNYKEALYEFQEELFHIDERTPSEAAKLCILEATLWEVLNDPMAEFDAISKGLSYSPGDYELFYMLGLYYMDLNVNKAYLCLEMSLFYCNDENDKKAIEELYLQVRDNVALEVRNVSIMILSYNDLEILKDCIDSIEKYQPPGSFEIIVVDNASTEEGVLEYLRNKRNSAAYRFELVENSENLGFPKGCNIGAAKCDPNNDIFFLNNDAVLMQNSLFFLRMGLYDDRNVGATGAMSNSASLQELDVKDILPDYESEDIPWHRALGYRKALECFREYAKTKCNPVRNPYIRRFRLTGFAVLVSRPALDRVTFDGQVFDEYFSPAYFEDDDLGIRLARAGFMQYLCKESLIYHNGGSGFGGNNEAMEEGRRRFIQKWGFDIWGYSLPWFEAADQVIALAKENRGRIRVMDFTCGLGATASYIKSIYPEIFVVGACNTSFEAGIASTMADEVIWGELNTIRIPWKSHTFDAVLADTTFVSKGRVSECLAEGGLFIDNK
ncbi:MAG: glycosyltransferase [Butyrivibrio sp.]|nr:glycosyltransferase [Butyrivibrio sp.]